MQSSQASFVESLESRRLLSAAAIHHGVLKVVGDLGAQSNITVHNNADGTAIDVAVHSVNSHGVARDFTASFPKTLPFTSVLVIIGKGDDTININQDNTQFGFVATRVEAASGKDTINTGSEDDVIYGGAGDDTINAGDGANRVFGENGDDHITTGIGNDRIFGGKGNDTISAGAGNDIIRGGEDDDVLDGGDGNDTFYGEKGNDTITGDAGNDIIWGGKGDDIEDGGAGDDQLGGLVGANTLTGDAGKDTFLVHNPDQNAHSDYSSTEDILTVLPTKVTNDGSQPPAI